MSRSARRGVADRMLVEIHEYLAGVFTPDCGDPAELCEAMSAPAEEMLAAVREWEDGRLSYEELEAAGVRYVEAWAAIAADMRAM